MNQPFQRHRGRPRPKKYLAEIDEEEEEESEDEGYLFWVLVVLACVIVASFIYYPGSEDAHMKLDTRFETATDKSLHHLNKDHPGTFQEVNKRSKSEEKLVKVETQLGDMTIRVYPEVDMPVTVGTFLKMVREGHYKGTVFHRAERKFLIQGGGRTLDNQYKYSPYHPIDKKEYKHPNEEYAVAMAGVMQEFFINCNNNTLWLGPGNVHNGKKYSNSTGDPVVGIVINGKEVIHKIENSAVTKEGVMNLLDDPVEITDMYIINEKYQFRDFHAH